MRVKTLDKLKIRHEVPSGSYLSHKGAEKTEHLQMWFYLGVSAGLGHYSKLNMAEAIRSKLVASSKPPWQHQQPSQGQASGGRVSP